MTQQEVADSLGVSNKTVSGWETGASCPDISMLPAIAELFGVTCDELLRGERIPPSEPQARTEEKREKVLARMLAHYKNTAAISAWLSAGLYLLAAVAALLIGCAVLESLIGFFVGLIFVLAGAFLCLIHGKYLRSQIWQDDFESAAAEDCLRALSSRQTAVLILAAAAFGFILPHVFVPVHFSGCGSAPRSVTARSAPPFAADLHGVCTRSCARRRSLTALAAKSFSGR